MSKCPCASFDWTGEDLTAEHHPKCTAIPSLQVTTVISDGFSGSVPSVVDCAPNPSVSTSPYVDIRGNCSVCSKAWAKLVTPDSDGFVWFTPYCEECFPST